tara:strand:+ start:235 stop:771 length:537 start_codon:yes stop_codon:yes gene_type:complete
MKYFETFPKLLYDIDNTKNLKLVSDIFRRIKIRESLKDNAALYSLYDVPSGESPETTAFKHFGSTDYFWVIMISNDITDRYYGWPLSESDFETYVKDKYSEPDGVHHYEVTQSSGDTTGNGPFDYEHKIEVNSTTVGAQSVSNRQFEERQQDKLRNIKLLDPKFLPLFLEEFERLVTR